MEHEQQMEAMDQERGVARAEAAGAALAPASESVVIRRQQLEYYQLCEQQLAWAMEQLRQRYEGPPKIIQLQDIKSALAASVGEAAAGALATLTGLAAPGPKVRPFEFESVAGSPMPADQILTEAGEMSIADAGESIETGRAGEDSHMQQQPEGFMTIGQLQDAFEPKPALPTIYGAVNAGKIGKKKEGVKTVYNVADYQAWLATYRPRK